MAEQPTWAENISADDLLQLIESEFLRKYSRAMTKRARRELRLALVRELRTLDSDAGYETGTESPEAAAAHFVDLAAGKLQLSKSDGVIPPTNSNSLKPYTRVGVGAVIATIEKARAYHEANDNLCPVWPF